MSVQTKSFKFKPFVPTSDTLTKTRTEKKRLRPHVPDDQRKRVRTACGNCREKKEKCTGDLPCQRCIRLNMDCRLGESPCRMTKTERSERLERVIKHILETSSLNDEELRAMSDSIAGSTRSGSINHLIASENSLLTFSRQLEKKLGDAGAEVLETDTSDHDIENAGQGETSPTSYAETSPDVHSGNQFADSILASLPSKDAAVRLVEVCFARVQCNSFYADEVWAREQIDLIYSCNPILSEKTVPTIATVAMLMALGTQFSVHRSYEPLGHVLHERTTSMLPVLIRRADFESVRACLLMATYMFPIDHSRAAYSYLGLALHMAIGIKLHKHCDDEEQVSVWWTLYTFYQRARIFHGYPKTLSFDEVEVRRPRLDPKLEPKNGPSNFQNQVTLIEITVTLEKISYEIALLRKHRKAAHVGNLLVHRRSMLEFEKELPHLDAQDDTDRLRLDIHLHLFYWHARLFAGRPFLLEQPSPAERSGEDPALTPSSSPSSGTLLRQDSVHAAKEIIYLCRIIHEKIGLAQSSYVTEFTSCRAAILVLIAHCITDMTPTISDLMAEGLAFIQQLSLSHSQAGSEARVLVALQRAIVRLHARSSSNETLSTNDLSHDQLRQWDMLWQQQSPDFARNLDELHVDSTINQHSDLAQNLIQSNRIDLFNQAHDDMWSAIFNAQLDEFSLLPTPREDFEYPGFSDLG